MVKHRKGSLTHARAIAKRKLSGMPVGSTARIGRWIDTGKYETKVGGGMNWVHERFMPIEQRVRTGTSSYRKTVIKKNLHPPLSKATSIPKGKRAGEHFTKNGKRYVVVSYLRSGKRVRFARRLKK